jgi:hypothetical protein
MDKHTGLMLLLLFVQMVTFIGVWGLMRELRLIGQVAERIRIWTSKRP